MKGKLLAQLAVLIAAALLVPGCRQEPAPAEAPAAEKDAIEQAKERGPVKVVLRVEPREPTFADRVKFTIEAFAKKGVQVTLPAPGENLGRFLIKDYDAAPEKVTADGTEHRRTYILEFITSGEYTIPPMTVAFRDLRPESEGGPPPAPQAPAPPEKTEKSEKSEKAEEPEKKSPAESPSDFKIVTDEIKIQVKPLADPGSLQNLAPIAPPAEPPPLPASIAWPLRILGGLAVLAALAYAAVRLLRREKPPPPPIPPHERAYRELEWLLGQGFIDRGELKEFYFHLSRILREYIENRFGLRAPEMTSEEFLETLGLGRGAPPRSLDRIFTVSRQAGEAKIPLEHRRLLRDFLERADLVKFARYTPGKEEIEASFEAAKRFIEGTIPAALPGPAAPGDPASQEAVHAG